MLALKLIHVNEKGHLELLIIKCVGMDGVDCFNNDVMVAMNRLVL